MRKILKKIVKRFKFSVVVYIYRMLVMVMLWYDDGIMEWCGIMMDLWNGVTDADDADILLRMLI